MTEHNDVALFKTFFQTNPQALVISSLNGEVIAANPAAQSLVGEQLVEGASLQNLKQLDDGPTLVALLEHLDERATPVSFETRMPGDDAAVIAWQLWRSAGRSEVFAVLSKVETTNAATARSPSDLDKPQDKPQDKEVDGRVLRAMLDNLDVLAWAVDKDGIYNFFDGKATAAIGAAPGALLGANVFQVFKDQISPAMKTALGGTAAHESISISGAHWENWYVPVRDAQGEYAGVIGISQNMNESQRIREELEARLALIERQQAVIRDLETPIIQVWDKVLTLPMIGIVDSKRAARVMEDLLQSVVRSSARFAILDLTGVELVDTATASYLLQMIHAIRLLGAEGILTGIRPTVAQTVISLGVDLKGIPTHGTLRHGLAYCIRQLGQGK